LDRQRERRKKKKKGGGEGGGGYPKKERGKEKKKGVLLRVSFWRPARPRREKVKKKKRRGGRKNIDHLIVLRFFYPQVPIEDKEKRNSLIEREGREKERGRKEKGDLQIELFVLLHSSSESPDKGEEGGRKRERDRKKGRKGGRKGEEGAHIPLFIYQLLLQLGKIEGGRNEY